MIDEAFDLACAMVLESGEPWVSSATDWQVDDLRSVLSADGPRWHFETRGRGGSKTTDLAVVALALLGTEAPLLSRSYAVATDSDQGGHLHHAMRGLVARTPGLSALFRVEARKVTAVDTEASIEVLAADGPSAYGLLPWLVVADELAQWPDTPNARQVWEAIVSAVPKVPGSRLVVLTSAGSPSHFSYRVLQRARKSARWHTSEVPGPVPWLDASELAEVEAVLPPSAVARLVRNEWTEPDDVLTTAENLRANVRHLGPIPPQEGVRYVTSLDMAYVNDRAVACVCHREASGRVVLDTMEVWQGSKRRPVQESDVEAWLVETHRHYGGRLVADPWQTKGLVQRLRAEGLPITEFTFSTQSVGRLALVLYRLLRDHAMALPDDPDLLDELATVRLRESAPGSYRLDHAHGKHDDRAVALALCAVHLVERAPDGPAVSSADVLTTARLPGGPSSSGSMEWTSVEDLPAGTVMAELHGRMGAP